MEASKQSRRTNAAQPLRLLPTNRPVQRELPFQTEEEVIQILAQVHDDNFNRLVARFHEIVEENQQLRSNLVTLAEDKAQFFQRLDRQTNEHASIVKDLTALNLKFNADNVRLQKENDALRARVDELTIGLAEVQKELFGMKKLLQSHSDSFDSLLLGQLAVNFKDKIYRSVYDEETFVNFEGWLPDWNVFMGDLDESENLQSHYDSLKGRVGHPPPKIGLILNSLINERHSAAHPYKHPDGHLISASDVRSAILKQPAPRQKSLLQLLSVVEKLAMENNESLFLDLS